MKNFDIKIPMFLEGEDLPPGYFDPVDPYSDPPKSQYDLRALINYAKSQGKRVPDLSKEEVKPFKIAVSTEEETPNEKQRSIPDKDK